jgi:FKBP-type peptidyl-prolyl cis-trans isomerase
MEENIPFANYPFLIKDIERSYNSLSLKLDYTEEQRKQKEQKEIADYMAKNNLTGTASNAGVYYIQSRAGSGKIANIGNKVKLHYTGKLLDGSIFDSSYDRGEPFEFELGAGQVIKGFEDAFFLRQAGSKAVIIIPYDQGYGSGEMAKMPAYSTLVFEVEILSVN